MEDRTYNRGDAVQVFWKGHWEQAFYVRRCLGDADYPRDQHHMVRLSPSGREVIVITLIPLVVDETDTWKIQVEGPEGQWADLKGQEEDGPEGYHTILYPTYLHAEVELDELRVQFKEPLYGRIVPFSAPQDFDLYE